VQGTLSRHWPFVLWVDWIETQLSPMADGQSRGHGGRRKELGRRKPVNLTKSWTQGRKGGDKF